MTRVDISADLNSEDETGLVWTFLDECVDPSIIRPGELVVAPTNVDRREVARLHDLVKRRPADRQDACRDSR